MLSNKIKKLIVDNFGLKVCSIFLAAFLWLVVVSIDDPTITRSFTQVPVELVNTETLSSKGNYFEVIDNTDTITVVATGKRSIIDSLSRDNFRATADVERLDNNLVPIEVRATKFADRLESVVPRTSNVRFSIEGLLERQIAINVVTEGNVSEECILGNITTDRSIVKVSGPESVVASIEKANVIVDITGISSDITTTGKIEFVNEDGDEVYDDRIISNISNVTLNIEVWGSKEVPVVYGYTGEPAEGFGLTGDTFITPSSIMIAADEKTLDSISEIAIPSSAVDISGAMSDMDIPVSATSYLPKGIALYGGEDVTLTVHVGVSALLLKSVQVNTSNIEIVNIPENMRASIVEPNEFIVATVSGIGNGFINLDETAISGTVDLSTVELKHNEDDVIVGEIYDVKVELKYPSGVVSDREVSVKVLIEPDTNEEETE